LPDRSDFLWANHLARETGWLHPLAVGYANDGVVLFAIPLLAGFGLAWARGDVQRLARAVVAGAGVLLAVAVNQPIVHGVAEPRPYRAMHHVLLLVHASADASFPSDHATMAGAAAVDLWRVHRRLGLVTAVAAMLMTASRVYVGAHYPVDVAAGLAVGAAVAAAAQSLLVRPVLRLLHRAEPALNKLPGFMPSSSTAPTVPSHV
jgi:membrane-associated phospholipid phosphatase